MVFQWWRNLRRQSRQTRQQRRPGAAPRRTVRLAVEGLEERAVPTASALSLLAGPNPPSVTATGPSSNPAVSGSGRYVVFQSDAADVVVNQSDVNNGSDIFLYDRTLGL